MTTVSVHTPGAEQTKEFVKRGVRVVTIATVRYGGMLRNGHNTLSVTGELWDSRYKVRSKSERGLISCGAIHDDIVRAFPQLSDAVMYHLCSTDGPTHYVANTVYHAGDKDHDGLRKGESKPITDREGRYIWERVMRDANGANVTNKGSSAWVYSSEPPTSGVTVQWERVTRTGTGKARELDLARNTAVWPDATDEELVSEGLEQRLRERLPALLTRFRAVVEGLGFIY